MNHSVITRCDFSDDKKFNLYLPAIKDVFIPSLNSQSCKNFKLFILINPKHLNLVYEMISKEIEIIPIMKSQKNTEPNWEGEKIMYFKEYKSELRKYLIDNDYKIQTRHDCDDYMASNYIEKIQQEFINNINQWSRFILNFHPSKLVFDEKKEYTHSRDYSRVCSMFSTLCQEKVEHSIFDQVHDKLNRITKNIIYIPENYVKLVLHGNNKLSKLNENDRLISENVQI